MKSDCLCGMLWAKTTPYRQLPAHMIDTGFCAKAYLEAPASAALLAFLSEEWKCSPDMAVGFAAYLAAMHDIGKATPQFQMQSDEQLARLRETGINTILPAVRLNPVRHEFLSESIAKRIWKNNGENRRTSDAYSCILSLHHQKRDTSDRRKPAVHEAWQQIQDSLEGQMRNIFHFSGNLPVPRNMDPVCILLTGLLILCDWVASSDAFDDMPEMADGYEFQSAFTARGAMQQYGLIGNRRINAGISFQSMWPVISKPRDIQTKCEQLDQAAPLTIIEAPMGEGKTEAALYLAARKAGFRGKRGIYVALPTQATSNQMFGRFTEMLKNINGGHARLMHGTAFLMKNEEKNIQSEDAAEAEKWLGTSRLGLLDENGVGTVDQAMGSVLLARFAVLRLLGLSNKALIIDELHAYDAYMSEIIASLLKWCRSLSIPVVLLSATLQNSQREKYLSCFTERNALPKLSDDYPLITQVTDGQDVVQIRAEASMRTEYRFEPVRLGQDEGAVARFAVNRIRHGGCYCILANTVKRAQSLYRAVRSVADTDTEIILFHARFPMGKREAIEKECLFQFGKHEEANRPKKAILVATQVVEQSLDIDFDGMISELAPIDLLLQRAGRVHRHKGRTRPAGLETPDIHVILPDDGFSGDPEERYGPSRFVYASFLLFNTEKLLENGLSIRVPQDVRSVIAQVYEYVSEENMKAWQERSFCQQLQAANAEGVAFPPPAPDYFFPAQAHPELEDMSVDDGFDPVARAATRLGEPTFRISFAGPELFEAVKNGRVTKAIQREILLSSVSMRLTPDIRLGLVSDGITQVMKGALRGCYVADQDGIISIGKKKLINDPIIGVYWEG